MTSGPAGETATDGAVLVGIDYVTAAEIASCTVSINGGTAEAVDVTYDPVLDDEKYSGALLLVADDLHIDRDSTTTLAVACQTTAAATLDDYAVTARFEYGSGEELLRLASVEVSPDDFGTLDDTLTIVAPAVTATPPTTAPTTVTTSAPVLAATGPADATGALRLGITVLLAGLVLLGGSALTGARAARRH